MDKARSRLVKKSNLPAYVTIPNCITSLRIIGTILLLFTAPLSAAFFIVYTICGVTDILDGWIARATNSTSALGSRLDSIADLLFYAISIIKLLPTLWRILPFWIWYIVGGIVVLRIASYTTAAIKFRRFASLHTKLNKITGAAVFLIPYSLLVHQATVYCVIVCVVAAAATIQEFVLHIKRKEYRENRKGLI